MLLLRLSATDLLALDLRRRMVPHLAARWVHFRGREASIGERTAWAESLIALAGDLVAADRGNVEMIVECSATIDDPERSDDSRQIDVVLAGRHPTDGDISVQLVELKRWSAVTRVERATAELVYVPGMDEAKKHPALQLREYYELFTGDNGPLNGLQFECGGFAYLHNATDESVRPLLGVDAPTGAYARVYTKDSRPEFIEDLRRHFTGDKHHSAAEILLSRMNLRNTPLLDAMIKSSGQDTVFTLRGRQKRVADDVLEAAVHVLDDPSADALVENPRRAVFLVTGGAGTGKSAIGLQLKAEFEAAGRSVKYASGSRAFNGAMQEHVGFGDREFKESFTYFSSFVTPPEKPLDVLICDEAHRLRDRSTSRFWRPERQGTKAQIDELLDASRLTLFFLDESQSVRPNEVGKAELIEDAARRRGVTARRYQLQEQYRCGGSDAYIRWVRDLLGLSEEAPGRWTPDGLMHVEVADTPGDMENILRTEFEAGASARMVAGFCWPWSPPDKKKRLVPDVRIGGWHRPWNASSDSFCAGGEPPSKIWSVHDAGFGQIGCVYTAQGLEWDWCGVIMGDDMVWRTDRWVFQRGKKRKDKGTGVQYVTEHGSLDTEMCRRTSKDVEAFERCVRHAYHVLLTRASRATVLYSTDKETREYLKKLVGTVEIHGLRPTWSSLPPELRVPHQVRPAKGSRGRNARRKKAKQQEKNKNDLMLF
ncbi:MULTISPECIES: DUF2075 domain-containing protein [unclassified Streptomyces]|uniref:DUF2075 domain-containing protein n=1 Tax=unclassified Streptomyces TaxID=2593676 RepID=UPI000C0833CF|nr:MULTISPECIES: DUF2075 domain-containing protein [unclassified Streptomyces]MYQ39469.1 DUF2075 domain-containing protein [Streptomyces sp. SID4921]